MFPFLMKLFTASSKTPLVLTTSSKTPLVLSPPPPPPERGGWGSAVRANVVVFRPWCTHVLVAV